MGIWVGAAPPSPRLAALAARDVEGHNGVAPGKSKTTDVGDHWVTTWGCGPQLTEPRNLPPAPLAHSTLRQFVRVTIGGRRLRVQFSNAFGTEPVEIKAAHIALAAGAGSARDGEIDRATDQVLEFGGKSSAVLSPGEALFSDPFDYELPALTNLAVTIYLGEISKTVVTGHPGSRTTSFIKSGNLVSENTMTRASRTAHWYLLTGIEVLTGASSGAIIVLGDSITDGRGSTTDRNDRWPDQLARRLAANAPTAHVSVVNMGIGGNAVLAGGLGPTALARFDRDVVGQSGARWLILFEGVNDIGASRGTNVATGLIRAFEQMIRAATAHGIEVYGATITPFGGSFYDSPDHESARETVNDWIRTQGRFGAVFDFDKVVRDPAHPNRLRPEYDSGDHLHLNPAGYEAMANAIPLNHFAP